MRRIVATIVLAATLAACGGPPPSPGPSQPSPSPSSSSTSGLATFDDGGLAFEYPAAWRVFHWSNVSSFSSVIAYLATVDIPEPCVTSGSLVSCADRYRLAPDTLVVTVMANGFPTFDMLADLPAGATRLTVGGLPAYVETGDAAAADVGADATVTWTLSRPGSIDNYYLVTAQIHGPDVALLRAEVEAAIASLRYDPPVVPLPSGTDAAAAAARKALGILAAESPAWSCFPTTPSSRQMVISSFPMGPDLARPQAATCTTRIEATPLQLWRMTLTLRLPEADPGAGQGVDIVVFVGPDGTPGQTTQGTIGP